MVKEIYMRGVSIFIFGAFIIWGGLSICSLTIERLPLKGGDVAFVLLTGFGLVCLTIAGISIRSWQRRVRSQSDGNRELSEWARKSFAYLIFVTARLLATTVLTGFVIVAYTGFVSSVTMVTAVVMVGLTSAWTWSVRQER